MIVQVKHAVQSGKMSAKGHFRPITNGFATSVMPPKADAERRRHVSFVPLADIADHLFNHLVGPHQQGGYRNAKRISGLEVDHQLEGGRLFDRDVGNLGAAEKFGHFAEIDECPLFGRYWG